MQDEIEILKRWAVDWALGRTSERDEGPPDYQPAPAPQRPSGRALRWSIDQIARLSVPTTADLERAKAKLAQDERTREFLLLLMAVMSRDAGLSSRYVWSYVLSRYLLIDRARGVIVRVSPRALQAMIDNYLETARESASRLMIQLIRGQVSIGLWQSLMRDEVVAFHLTTMAVAAGGMRAAEMSAVPLPPEQAPPLAHLMAGHIAFHLDKLDRFARDIETGAMGVNGDLFTRAEFYAQAARLTYYDFDREQNQARGVREARRVRTILESCAGCVREAGGLLAGGRISTVNEGFKPIADVKPLGGEECRMNCLCFFQYRAGGPSRASIREELERIREAVGFQ